MIDIRCGGCGRLLGKAASFTLLQIKCPRCRVMNQIATSCPSPERPRAPRYFEVAHGQESPPPGSTGTIHTTYQ
ncbi:Com family DNA-binding transcriptional regulator [Pseudomonas berkeleyensis]|uniref:Com family DNA-binding transcriptional regulator n=1 Tax=Pseudomonas berkeleyensis TaxID=2726956 RepID=A0A7G5DWI6_9PSED|nr:Com family DNA-binding transcriptional regulator [Pseudomonas berkeleyensis]